MSKPNKKILRFAHDEPGATDVSIAHEHHRQAPGSAAATAAPLTSLGRLIADHRRNYDQSPWTLLYVDDDLEREYVDWVYVEGGGYGARMYGIAAFGLWFVLLLWFPNESFTPKWT